MQEIHAFGGEGGGGGGRFYGGGDRRLRPHNHPNNQVLKCPRCDSLNTKFCYYNNYNLSQPRHFCKNCRRYWTKGGVLRNVPVGGGCRKAKRSKPKPTAGAASPPRERSSSSESSSLTAAATPPSSAATAAEDGSAPATKSVTAYDFPDGRFFDGNPNSDHRPAPDGQIFTADVGSFTGLMEFGMGDIQATSYGRLQNQAPAAELDWGGGGGGGSGGDQGLFDLTAAVDPAYWAQPHWNENDQSLNFLP